MPIVESAQPAETNPRRLALIICNGTYADIPSLQLRGPAQDAVLLEAALSDPETCRFEALCLLDQGLLEVRRGIARICADAREDDTLLIYYSGNGFLGENNSLYLLVSDSDQELPHATALDTEFVLSQLRRSACRKIILLIDCCHSGASPLPRRKGCPSCPFRPKICEERRSRTGMPWTMARSTGTPSTQGDIPTVSGPWQPRSVRPATPG